MGKVIRFKSDIRLGSLGHVDFVLAVQPDLFSKVERESHTRRSVAERLAGVVWAALICFLFISFFQVIFEEPKPSKEKYG